MRVPDVRGNLLAVFPVAFDCRQWWLARWVSRMFTSLAVAVALALSGGPLAGGLSTGPDPLAVDRLAPRFDATVLAVGLDPSAGVPQGWTHRPFDAAPVGRSVHPDRAATGDGGAAQVAVVPTDPAQAVPAAPATVGFPPVRALAGAPSGAVGPRAPPVG